MELLTVGEMSRRSGVPATTLRYYDSLGLLVPIRLANAHRRYPESSVERLRFIRLCQVLGCELDEIRDLLAPGAEDARRTAARRELTRIDRQFRRLEAAKAILVHFADCACVSAEECHDITRDCFEELNR